MIRPILCYGCELWEFTNNQELNRTEMSFLKHALGLPITATNSAIRGELGHLYLQLFWKEKILNYWMRLCRDDIPVLLARAATMASEISESGYQMHVTKGLI